MGVLSRVEGPVDGIDFPWAWTASHLLAARAAGVTVDHTPRRQFLRVRAFASVRIGDRRGDPETVTCVIGGYDRLGKELVNDELSVSDDAVACEYRDVCGYSSTFDCTGRALRLRLGCGRAAPGNGTRLRSRRFCRAW